MSEWCVYMHENRVNGKKYIGITKQHPERRWQNGYGYRECPRFFNAIQKHGWDAFRHDVLFTGLTAEEAAAREVELIAKYQTTDPAHGYNLDPGGGGTSPKLPEVRERMSRARQGTHPTPETIEKLRAVHRGKTQSAETRAKRSAALRGVAKSAEHCRKIGETHSKAVEMLTVAGERLGVFTSLVAAEEATGVCFKNISSVCNGRRKTAGGFLWRFLNRSEADL